MRTAYRTRILTLLLLLLTASVAGTSHCMAQNKIYRYTHMGNQQFFKGNTEKAAAYYRKVLQKSPSNSRAMFNLADTYLTKGDVKAADSLYNRVTQIDKNSQIRAMAWHNRGYISQMAALKNKEQEQNMLRQAIEHYKQSLRLNPRDNRTRYNLALCQKQLKNDPNKQNNKDKQQNKKQQQDKQQNKNQQNKKQQQKQEQQKQQSPQDKQQMQQYMNLAKQAEKRALEKLKQHQPRQRSLQKNW